MPVAKRRMAFGSVAIAIAVVSMAAVVVVTRPSPGPTAVVGTIDMFPPGSVTAVPFSVAVGPDPLISPSSRSLLFVVNHPEEGLLALWARDPHRGCTVGALQLLAEPIEIAVEPDAAFTNPCHGEQYALDGTRLAGPGPRGLDRFGIEVRADGDVVVDVSRYELGEPASP